MNVTEDSVNRVLTGIGIAIIVTLFALMVVKGIKDVTTMRGPKDSLTAEELDWLEHHNDMTGYSYNLSSYTEDYYTMDYKYQNGDKEIYSPVYDINRESIVVTGSNIEDGMIYTTCDAELRDGTKVQLLYINHPTSLKFVALSVMYDDLNGLFTFRDANGKTVYDY